jgi:hypothetical protein
VTTDPKQLAAVLLEMAQEAQNASSYANGLSDGLFAAAAALDADAFVSNDNSGSRPSTAYRIKKQPTQGPVIEALKANGSMSVTSIIKWARARGHDLLRPTVKDVLERLMKRGLVKANGQQYQLLDSDD